MKRPHVRVWSLENGETGDDAADGFWASYSDLMAGLLMIFVLSSVLFTHNALETTSTLQDWRAAKERLCNNPALQRPDVEIKCATGAIHFAVDDWFDFNSAVLKPNGQAVLREVMPLWMEEVGRESIWEKVDAIEFGGHADRKTKSEIANMQISAERALAVRTFLMGSEIAPDELRQKGVVVGYGAQQFPPPEECPSDECVKARRVVVTVKLNETSVLEDLWRILGVGRR